MHWKYNISWILAFASGGVHFSGGYLGQTQDTPFSTPGLGEPIGVGFLGDRSVRGNG